MVVSLLKSTPREPHGGEACRNGREKLPSEILGAAKYSFSQLNDPNHRLLPFQVSHFKTAA